MINEHQTITLDVAQEKKTFAELLRHLHKGGKWGHWVGKNQEATWWVVNEWAPLPTGDVYFNVNPLREIPPTNSKGQETEQCWIRSQVKYLAGINCVYAEIDGKDFVEVPQNEIEAFADQTEGAYATRQDALDAAKIGLEAQMFKDNVARFKALALERVASWEPIPSAVVDSGGGYQVYWLLRNTFKFDKDGNLPKAGRLQRTWVESVATGADTGAKNLNRILRVAGTFNHKPIYGDPPPMVHFVKELTDLARVYSLKELEARVLEADPGAFDVREKSAPSDNTNLAEKIVTANDCLLRMSSGRARSYDGRVEVGMILYNELGDIGFPLWFDWLQKHSEHEHDREKCKAKWASFNGYEGDKLGLGTLVTWAKEDATGEKKSAAVDFRNTDLGNAQRVVRQHGANVRYCHQWGKWLVWDGQRWAEDDTGAIQRLARETVKSMYAEASKLVTPAARVERARWAVSSESRYRLRAMVDVAQDEPGIPVRADDLDADPWLLNVQNGTLDLRTGELRPHRRDDLFTKLAPVEYHPDATCPQWQRFLMDVLPDPALRAFVRRGVGYSLTGVTTEHCLQFAYGTGNNGKSTFFEVQMTMLGDYAQKAPADMLLLKRGRGGVSNDIARLPGARFVVAAEVGEGRWLDEAIIKDLTGGDTMSARFLYKELFDFKPTHKLWMYGNHKPRVRGTDEGIWRRINLTPFTVMIKEPDINLVNKLKTELPGILAWAVRGCLEWQEVGLNAPEAVDKATAEYRQSQDEVGRFLKECCYVGDRAEATKGALFDAYAAWGGLLRKRRFGDALRKKGTREGRGTGNAAVWWGIGLLDD